MWPVTGLNFPLSLLEIIGMENVREKREERRRKKKKTDCHEQKKK